MKNYETGICAVCGERKEAIYHITNDSSRFPLNLPPHDFKDSGLAQLEANAPKLLEKIQKYRAVVEKHAKVDVTVLVECAEAVKELDQAINEALKRE